MQLFVDMDGVLADFDQGYFNCFGDRPCKISDNVNWELVKQKNHFYKNLPPMKDFNILWKGVESLKPIILTGIPSHDAYSGEAIKNKREWVDKHIGKEVKMIGCKSKDKSLHSKPGDILIDDWEKYKHVWIGNGGIWITHTSAKSSLEQLYNITGYKHEK